MKQATTIAAFAALSIVLFIFSCSKKADPPSNPCAGVTVTVTGAVTNTTQGQSNGQIVITATGGTGFTYSINGGAYQSSNTFSNLPAGNHTVSAKNSNGCTGSQQFTIVEINPCAGVTITVTGTVTNTTTGQNNGSIVAAASGSTGFTYSLNGGTFQASGTFNNLAAGTYTITAKDGNGCTGSAQFMVGTTNPCTGVTITVTGTVTNTTTGQTNGSIVATASGSTGFTYSLNGGTFQATGTFNNLAAGTYTVTAKDGNNCTGSSQFTVGTTNPCTGVTITVTGTVTNATTGQNNGSIAATASGSTGFMYSLNGGAFQASGTFNNLAAATYTVTARDANNCTGSSQFTVGITNPCAGVNIVINTTTTSATPCANPVNGSITVTASGSTGFTYSINGTTFQASNVFNNLSANTYTVTVKDANGCTNTANATVGVTPAGTLFTDVKQILQSNCVSCHNSGNASGGMDWTVDCNIVNFRNNIKTRAVDHAGTGSQMPPPPSAPLSTSDRQKIVNWINAGGGYNH